MKINKRVFITASFIVIMMSSIFFLESKHESKKFRLYARYWRHRQNGVEYARESLNKGFKGIEVDVHWSGSKFYLSHEAKDNYSGTDTLDPLFENTKDFNYNLLIDFKNLGFFNARKACAQLNEMLDKYERLNTTLIESKSFYALHLCRKSKLHASYWMSFAPDSTFGQVRYWIYKQIQRKYQFEFVSLDKYLGEKVINEISSQYTTLIFTIRNDKEKQTYEDRKNIKVMLVSKGMNPEGQSTSN